MSEPAGGTSDDPIKLGRGGLVFLCNMSARALSRDLDAALAPHGLDHGCLVLLRNVVRDTRTSPEGVTISSLASKLILPVDVLSRRAEQLRATGWLEVDTSPQGMLLRPTHRTLANLSILTDATRWTVEKALNGFSRDEIEQLSAMLKRVLWNMDVRLGPDDD